jgi:type II secretory pathway component PulF
MTFAYTAVDSMGRKRTGVIDAASADAATQALAADGRFVIEIAEEAQKKEARQAVSGRGVSRADLSLFTRRLADLSAAGLPLDRVLSVIAEQSESKVLAEVAHQVLDEVRGGRPVSESLAMHPKLFSTIYTQTLRAGEASGQFPEVATRLADFQESEVTRRSQIVSALTYPVILAVVAVLIVVALLTFVVPALSGVFKDMGSSLPATTQLLLAITGFLTKDYLYIAVGIVVLIVGYRAWVATEAGALARDNFLLHAPVLGPIVRKSTVSRFSRVLATLVYGGVPILEALELSGKAAGNRVFLRSAEQVQGDVREGQPIAAAMRDAGAFPPVLTNMVAVGEETGNLPLMLNRVSDSLDFEVDNGLRRVTSLVEPIIVLIMGAVVGFVVVSVLLPIYQAQDVVK